MSSQPLSQIPRHLRIRVIEDDTEFVVIEKPCNLRSVPGHANPPPSDKKRKRSPSQPNRQRTAQEAWVEAIISFQGSEKGTDAVHQCLQRLASFENKLIESVPRKCKLFRKYVARNQRRLMIPKGEQLEELSIVMFQRIEARQKPLMNLPEPTRDEDSALGQLLLMQYGNSMHSGPSSRGLLVVHRLDCETSGVMVFAKSEEAASFLSKAWRERDKVSKKYLAMVTKWPPYHSRKEREGIIEIPLEPSEERLKWKVSEKDGKPSVTKWKVVAEVEWDSSPAIVLELQPETGRTHQLRVHCAHIGSGIIGDSLYGKNRVEFDPSAKGKLHLHAWKLSFPHPTLLDQTRHFEIPPPWFDEFDHM